MANRLDTSRFIAVMVTCEQSAALIERGLAGAHHLCSEGPEQFLALHDLSAGVERLCKAVLWSEHWVRTNTPMTTQELKSGFGHDIRTALLAITDRCFPEDYLKRPAALADQHWLTTDARLAKLVDVLSDFGSGGRYFDLNVAGGTADYGNRPSPSDLLDSIANEIARTHTQILTALSAPSAALEAFRNSVKHVVTSDVERLTRALARLFTLGPLRVIPHAPSLPLRHFVTLADSDLGKRSYH